MYYLGFSGLGVEKGINGCAGVAAERDGGSIDPMPVCFSLYGVLTVLRPLVPMATIRRFRFKL